ncbi:Alpha carbonic anhydrase [Trinorchestia longiramus]|nr:Alpha carbonic anhydrase [Trinorchestia longiramus]
MELEQLSSKDAEELVSGTINNTGHGIVFTLDGEIPPLWAGPAEASSRPLLRGYGADGKRRRRGIPQNGSIKQKSKISGPRRKERRKEIIFGSNETFNTYPVTNLSATMNAGEFSNDNANNYNVHLNRRVGFDSKSGTRDLLSFETVIADSSIHSPKELRKRDLRGNLYKTSSYSPTWSKNSYGGFGNYLDKYVNSNFGKNSHPRITVSYNNSDKVLQNNFRTYNIQNERRSGNTLNENSRGEYRVSGSSFKSSKYQMSENVAKRDQKTGNDAQVDHSYSHLQHQLQMMGDDGRLFGGKVDYNANKHPILNVTGGPLSYRYQVAQVQLHFGDQDDKGSEHTINGTRFPAEFQALVKTPAPVRSCAKRKSLREASVLPVQTSMASAACSTDKRLLAQVIGVHRTVYV